MGRSLIDQMRRLRGLFWSPADPIGRGFVALAEVLYQPMLKTWLASTSRGANVAQRNAPRRTTARDNRETRMNEGNMKGLSLRVRFGFWFFYCSARWGPYALREMFPESGFGVKGEDKGPTRHSQCGTRGGCVHSTEIISLFRLLFFSAYLCCAGCTNVVSAWMRRNDRLCGE